MEVTLNPVTWVGLASFLLYAWAIYNVSRVLRSNLNPSHTSFWVVLNLAVPIIGVPLYALFGEVRLANYIKRRDSHKGPIKTFATRQMESEFKDFKDSHTPRTRRFDHCLGQFGPQYQVIPGGVDLLSSGEETFTRIFEALAGASKYIFIQYYIVRSDRLGLELKRILIEKAKAGVQVYFLYDDIGSLGIGWRYIRDLRKAGVYVANFLPLRLRLSPQLNFRNHRKIVVVDGKIAFTGGLNIGEEYLGRSVLGSWRDTHLALRGLPCYALEEVFLDDWHFAADDELKMKPFEHHGTTAFSVTEPYKIQVVPFGPSDKEMIGLLTHSELISSANDSIFIATPYFVPDQILMHQIELALLRGVKITILLPKNPDHRSVQWVSLFYARTLAHKGADVYLYAEGFMHQKVIVVDQAIASIGTCNFDFRGMYLNFETCILVHDREFSGHVLSMLDEDLRHSEPLPVAATTKKALREIGVGFVRMFAPLM